MYVSTFMFHDIYTLPVKYPERWYMKSFLPLKTFIDRIDYIEDNYKIISIEDINNKELDPSVEYAIITFDDGVKSQYDYAFKILKERKIPATFFIPALPLKDQYITTDHKIQFLTSAFSQKMSELVLHILDHVTDNITGHVTDHTDNDYKDNCIYKEYSVSKWENNWWTPEEVFVTRFFREYPHHNRNTILNNLYTRFVDLKERLYMNIEEITDIVTTQGMTIGGHGWKSINMDFASNEEILEEILETKNFLNEFGVTNYYFSYPNGACPKYSIDLLKTHGFSHSFTTKQVKINQSDIINNPLCLGRFDGSQYTFYPKIVICGVQEQLVEILYYLRQNNIYITHVVTIDEKEAQRQKASGWVSYEHRLPDDVQIKYLNHYGMKNDEDYRFFQEERFDILLLGGWQRLIPERVLRTFKYGGIGQHGSSDYLPKYRGRSPINWSIILGKKRIIWHIFYMTAGVDDGEIIDFETFQINEWDDCNTIYYKISIVVKEMYKKNIPKILSETVSCIPQKGDVTFYTKRVPEDGKISFNDSVYSIYNLVRGVTRPYPGAFCYVNRDNGQKKVMIWKCQPFDSFLSFYIDKCYGEIVEVFNDGGCVVKCEEGLLLITESDDDNAKVGDLYY